MNLKAILLIAALYSLTSNATIIETPNEYALSSAEKETLKKIQKEHLAHLYESYIANKCGRSSLSAVLEYGPLRGTSDAQGLLFFLEILLTADYTNSCKNALAEVKQKMSIEAAKSAAAYSKASYPQEHTVQTNQSNDSAAAYSKAAYNGAATPNQSQNSAASYSKASYPR